MTAKEKDAILLAIKENRFRELTESDRSIVLEFESCMYIAVTRSKMGNAHKLLGLGEKILNDGGFAGIESKAKKAIWKERGINALIAISLLVLERLLECLIKS